MRLLLAAILAISFARGATVSELLRTVRDALAARQPDTQIADLVTRVKLDERLDDAVIEQLQSEGAAARTLEQLEWQREDSSLLPAPKDLLLFAAPPAPPEEEQRRLVARARSLALEYTANLPNFLCTESVRRYVRPKDRGWRPTDTFTMAVSYSPKGESYKLLTIDGKPATKTLKSMGGFKSDGEFGSLLGEIYRPGAAEFRWERWANLRGQRVAVFAYLVERHNSKYEVTVSTGFFRTRRIHTGMIGQVYIDPETAQTLRFSDGDDGLPSNFAIRKTYSVLDYDYADIAGRPHLLPKRVDLRVTFLESRARNVMEFGNYRKFSSDATVTFEKQ